jgi:hypothetical protein
VDSIGGAGATAVKSLGKADVFYGKVHVENSVSLFLSAKQIDLRRNQDTKGRARVERVRRMFPAGPG